MKTSLIRRNKDKLSVLFRDEKSCVLPFELRKAKYKHLAKLYLFLRQKNNDLSSEIEEFSDYCKLTKCEFVTAIYHDLLGWKRNKPGSKSADYRAHLLFQLLHIYPWLETANLITHVKLGWILQEYICSETGDYSFGVYQPDSSSDTTEDNGDNDDALQLMKAIFPMAQWD